MIYSRRKKRGIQKKKRREIKYQTQVSLCLKCDQRVCQYCHSTDVKPLNPVLAKGRILPSIRKWIEYSDKTLSKVTKNIIDDLSTLSYDFLPVKVINLGDATTIIQRL